MDLNRLGSALPTTGQANGAWNSSGKNQGTTSSKAGKQQYVTVQDGDYLYTYLVIGEHIKVLIGRTPANKEEVKDEQTAQEQDKLSGADTEALDKLTEANKTGENKLKLLEYTSNMDVETFLQCRLAARAKQHA